MNFKICVMFLILGVLSFVPVVSATSHVDNFIDVSNYTINAVRDTLDDTYVSSYNESANVNSTDGDEGNFNYSADSSEVDNNSNSSNDNNSSLSGENGDGCYRISVLLEYCNWDAVVDFCDDVVHIFFP